MVPNHHPINRRLKNMHFVNDLPHQWREYSVSFSTKVREHVLVMLNSNSTRWGPSVLILVLVLVQCRIIVSSQRIITRPSRNTRMTFALSGALVTNRVNCSSNVTSTILAAEKIPSKQVKRTVFALVTGSSSDRWFASTLTCFGITRIQSTNGTVHMAIALFTPLRIRNVQVPVERLALVTDPSSNSVLALTQLAGRHRSTACKPGNHSRRVTVTLLAGREIVEPFFALFTILSVKVVVAQTLSLRVTGDPVRPVRFAFAGQTFGILVVAGTTKVTLFSREILQTGTFSRCVTDQRNTSDWRTVAWDAVWVVVVAGDALITTRSSETFPAETLAVWFVAYLVLGSSNVAVTIWNRRLETK